MKGGNNNEEKRERYFSDIFIGSCDIGQGIKTIACQILSDEIGVPYEQIVIHNRTTDDTGICFGTFASRVTYYAGNAIRDAAADVRKQMFEFAAPVLKVSPDQLSVKDGKVFATNDPSIFMNISDLAAMVNWGMGRPIIGKGYFAVALKPILDEERGLIDVITTLAYGASCAEVEVDTETGEVELLHMENVYDSGKTINPLLASGQIDGGVVMGIGSTFSEDCNPYYPTDDFKPKNFSDYVIPTAMDVPPMHSEIVEFPSAGGPYGAKGFGEMTTNSVSPAIVNAIHDAVGIWIDDIPVTPEKILRALDSKGI
jgi:CO/xanthine dehydrogenase Mo-binding subunit